MIASGAGLVPELVAYRDICFGLLRLVSGQQLSRWSRLKLCSDRDGGEAAEMVTVMCSRRTNNCLLPEVWEARQPLVRIALAPVQGSGNHRMACLSAFQRLLSGWCSMAM